MLDANHMLLFDIRTDPGERVDLAGRRQDVVRDLRARLADWERDVDAEAKSSGPPK